MRCRTLARELQRRGALVTFLCRQQPGDLINLLIPASFPSAPWPSFNGVGGAMSCMCGRSSCKTIRCRKFEIPYLR